MDNQLQHSATDAPAYISLYVMQPLSPSMDLNDFEPAFHPTYDDALGSIWDFVKQRILNVQLDMYIEDFLDQEERHWDYDAVAAQLAEVLSKEDVIDWYFESERDELTLSFYYIKEIPVGGEG